MDPRQMMRDALSGLGASAPEVSSFSDEALQKLCDANFHLPGRLQAATRDDLLAADLKIGDASFIVSKNRQDAAAGLGPQSAAAAGFIVMAVLRGP
ncbi:hypothetical protein TSOC_003110 [Tetrabaena socialis]|uniref:Uncharacterized protein n=1 Tax=Tetrabaena socialis TaxID=47790 RepID=A0A2J8ACC6_9CHLO|nr:hypothetical protein TSOC_003110 [Tetrabaena socialis]|eukprot:PNH10169.1 hypothetical protein TSOC_003110 [Tetrabaena socialis]